MPTQVLGPGGWQARPPAQVWALARALCSGRRAPVQACSQPEVLAPLRLALERGCLWLALALHHRSASQLLPWWPH